MTISYLFAINEDMSDSRILGEFELMILLTILRCDNQTYGVPLASELSNLYGRSVALGSVYAALDRLELKRLVRSTLGESTPERGGRAKRLFSVTAEGVRSLHETRRLLSGLWKKLPPLEGERA